MGSSSFISQLQRSNTMENPILLTVSFLCLSLFILKLLFSTQQRNNKLPPGPKPWPILGNILQLTDKPHHALADMSKLHGPLITLKLGQVTTVVVSSADMAREAFVNHDLALSSRHVPDAIRALNHDLHSMAWLPVAPKWRSLRKLAVTQLFSVKCLNQSQALRHKKVLELLEYVDECRRSGLSVDIGRVGFTTSLNLLSNTFFSKDMAMYSSDSLQELRDAVWGVMECAGKPNLADFFPILAYFDPLGIRRDLTGHFSKLFAVFDDMIRQRKLLGDSSAEGGDVLDTLLRMSDEDGSDLSLDDIKHLLLDFFVAGTDTTSNTLEWAMAELLRSPSKMKKAQLELNEVIGNKNQNIEKLVRETDVERLPYLQAIVKETLRLHPPIPLSVPRKARDEVQICGYTIPQNTKVLVNAWAIGRDPDTWNEANEFLPERFLDGVDIDFRGQNFELIPFGAGRRICPGLPLANRMLHIMLATLLHAFHWELPNGMKGQDIDMNDKFGIAIQKAKPLLAIPIIM